MRILFGLVLGIILTVGAAYVTDSMRNTSGGEASAERPLVNWEVAHHDIESLSAMIQDGWARLTGHPKDK